MKRLALPVLLLLTLTTAGVYGQCQFDGFGTISNPDEPSCRDARFTLTENDASGNNIALGYPPPLPVDSLTAVDGFRSYASLHARQQDLLLTSANVDGQVVGQTLANRDIWAYRLGDADSVTPAGFAEPAVLANGGIHAREWQSPEAVTELFEQLVENAADSGFGQFLADGVNVVILPVNNIDGFIQTQLFPTSVAATAQQPRDGRMRRKNLRNPSGGANVDASLATGDDQYFGVDLNRNSRRGFGLNNGSSPNPVSLVYRGAAPASEPEIQALLGAAALGPANRLRFYTDVHSFTQVFFIPQTGQSRRDTITAVLANRIRAVTGNKYRTGFDPVGANTGLTSDYFAYELGIPSWTLETEPQNGGQDYGGTGASHSGFVLPDSEVARMRDEIAAMLMLGYYRQAGPPALVAASITRRSDNAVVYRGDWLPDPATASRSLSVSVNDGLEANGEYRLWLAYDKPMRYTTDGVTVSNYPGQNPAAFPAISLDAGAAATALSIAVSGDAGNWLGQPGGAPDGYLRYRFDALAADFDMPDITTVTALSLSVRAEDLAQMRQDANPATAVDWQNAAWSGYENALGTPGDSGGADCQQQTFAVPAGSMAAAPAPVACKAAFVAPPPPPAPPPPATTGGGGGGGAPAPAVLILLLVTLALRRRG